MIKYLDTAFQWFMWNSRLIILLAVFSIVLAAIFVIIIGTCDLFLNLKPLCSALFQFFSMGHGSLHNIDKQIILSVVSAMDTYLVATVLLIFGIGIYELMVKRLDFDNHTNFNKSVFRVENLDQLKDKLAKVIVMVLIVAFCRYALGMQYHNLKDLLFLSIGIMLITISVYLKSMTMKA